MSLKVYRCSLNGLQLFFYKGAKKTNREITMSFFANNLYEKLGIAEIRAAICMID